MRRLFTTAVAIIATYALVGATNASALSGSPIDAGSHFESLAPTPSVAVDSAGTAYVVWVDEEASASTGDTVLVCVIPSGALGCSHSEELKAGGGADPRIDNAQVLTDGATVVVLADVFGVGEEFEPEQEWTSTDGGATFAQVNGGKSVAEGILSADTEPLGAIIVPGTSVLGYGWVTAAGAPTFNAFPLASPPQCSVKTGHTCPFATLQEAAPLLSNENGVLASQLGTNPGVLGVYETLGKPGCASGTFDTAYVYGSGPQEATNSYNIDPGKPNTAWKKGLSPGDCEVEYPAVGGGPSGFGVVEDDLTRNFTVYHPFDQTNQDFDTPYFTIAQEGELSPSVSQDGGGGIYVTYLAGPGGAIRLAYSSTGGASWTGPATLNGNADFGANNVTSSVNAVGQGWVTWTDKGSVFAQPFFASDAIPPAAPISSKSPTPTPTPAVSLLTIPKQTDSVTSKGELSIAVDCTGAKCSGSLTLIVKLKKTTGKGKKKKTKTVTETIGTASFNSLSLGTDTVLVKLNGKGKGLLAADGYKLSATASATYLSGSTFKTTTGDVKLKGHKPSKVLKIVKLEKKKKHK